MRSRMVIPLLVLSLTGCGGSSQELPPAAEPARSPPLRERPAGRVVHVGHKPEGLAFDSRTGLLAVGLTNPDRLALVDGRTLRTVRRIRLPESPRHLALAGPGGPVLVPAEKANDLVEVSLPDGAERVVHVGRNPHDAVEARGRAFVGDELGHTVSVVEGNRVIRVLPAPLQPGGLAATSDQRLVGVVGVKQRALRIFEAGSLRRVGDVDVGVGPTHVAALKRRFFVVDTRGNGLLEVRLRDEPFVHRRTQLAGAPYGIALDTRHGRFWVTLTGRNRVVEVTDRHVLRSFPTVRQPNSVAVDSRGGRVFVASRSDGTLQAIDSR